jgi:hypothetical protein
MSPSKPAAAENIARIEVPASLGWHAVAITRLVSPGWDNRPSGMNLQPPGFGIENPWADHGDK